MINNFEKEFLTGRIDEVEKKLRAIIIRVDDIQENFRNSMKLEKRLANIEKTLENVSINRDKTKEKNDEHFFKSNTKTKDEPIKNVYEPSTKYSVDYSKNFYENKTEDLKNSRDFAEISNVKNGRDMNKRANRKEKNKSIKDDNFDYYKNGNRDIKEYELKNESKYSQLFNKISTERPYLQDSNNYENKIFKESKNLRNNLNGGEEILSSFPKERTNKPDHQKSHSFYLNPEEENLKKKNHSSIENVEKQEKRKKIDEGLYFFKNI